MPAFSSNPLKSSPLQRRLRRYPLLFGVPFIAILVGASFGLQSFSQTRYDLQDQRVTQVTKQEALGLDKNKKKFDIREEYYRLSSEKENDWEPKRIPRPKGVPEWGVPPESPPQKTPSSDP